MEGAFTSKEWKWWC